jgi:hypothetical protein
LLGIISQQKTASVFSVRAALRFSSILRYRANLVFFFIVFFRVVVVQKGKQAGKAIQTKSPSIREGPF